jgi:glutamine amidotransferase
MRIALVDYGMGNLLSVKNALEHVGATLQVASSAAGLDDAGAVVLPGVGAFGEAMRELRARGLQDALEEHVRVRKKPFLGICLGLQLLGDRGHELGTHDGLGWVPGEVERLDVAPLRVPHIGWSEVEGKGPLFAGIPERSAFYFVHSFHLVSRDPSVVHGTTAYGRPFVSAVQAENVMAVQFHPEKSHKWGLELLRNFVRTAERA